MTRRQEELLWDFCEAQQLAFHGDSWLIFGEVDHRDLALVAVYLGMADWYAGNEVQAQLLAIAEDGPIALDEWRSIGGSAESFRRLDGDGGGGRCRHEASGHPKR